MAITARRPSQKLVDLVGALGGRWSGNMAMCRCPAHSDTNPSLSLRQGDKGILVTCFAGCDPIDVLRELDRIAVTKHYDPPPAKAGSGTANIERLWNEAGPVQGTFGERYLAGRFLTPIPVDVRFHPRCPHGPKPHTVFKPALLVAVREGMRLVAVQRIFLDPATGRYTEKVTLGIMGRGAWQGGGLAPTIGLAEGFETARAWSILHNLPCWSTLGSRRFDLVSIPESVTTLILAGDPDVAGRRAIRRASAKYASDDREIEVDVPKGRFDWAKVLELQMSGGGEGR